MYGLHIKEQCDFFGEGTGCNYVNALTSHKMCFILSQRDAMLNSFAVSDGLNHNLLTMMAYIWQVFMEVLKLVYLHM